MYNQENHPENSSVRKVDDVFKKCSFNVDIHSNVVKQGVIDQAVCDPDASRTFAGAILAKALDMTRKSSTSNI